MSLVRTFFSGKYIFLRCCASPQNFDTSIGLRKISNSNFLRRSSVRSKITIDKPYIHYNIPPPPQNFETVVFCYDAAHLRKISILLRPSDSEKFRIGCSNIPKKFPPCKTCGYYSSTINLCERFYVDANICRIDQSKCGVFAQYWISKT